MQFKFEGAALIEGDSVYVVGQGPAKVIDMKPSYFRIRVAGRVRKVSFAGIQSGDSYQTVFWRNPIVVKPAKNAALWAAMQRLILSVTQGFQLAVANEELTALVDDQEDLVDGIPVTQNAASLQEIIEQAHKQKSASVTQISNGANVASGE